MERKKKLRIIQLSLLFLGFCIILFTYSENKDTIQKKEILTKTTKEKIDKELKGKNPDEEANVFYNISYSGIDLSGNRYVLKSKIAKTNLENDELIDMTEVKAVELIGANTLIHGKLENSNEILVASISGVVKEDTIGKNINLSIQNDKLHLFDTNTDLRIN